MKITAEPRSDQWNADDFVGGPRTFTIAGVRTGSAEQKYDIDLVEGEGRSWRPPLTVLRLLIAAWGDDGAQWVGRRVTLFRDPSITFGRDQVGGIRVSHLSHIDKPLSVSLTVKRGSRAKFKVDPMPAEAAPVDYAAQIDAAPDVDALRALWSQIRDAGHMTDALDKTIKARVEALSSAPESGVGADAEGAKA